MIYIHARVHVRTSVQSRQLAERTWSTLVLEDSRWLYSDTLRKERAHFLTSLRASLYIRIILHVRVRAYYMYGTTAKFKSANIFISAARDQTAKFKDHQYFRLYGMQARWFMSSFSWLGEVRSLIPKDVNIIQQQPPDPWEELFAKHWEWTIQA